MSSVDSIRFGYWPYRQLNGEIPNAIRHPGEYSGSDVLNISCTQTGLPSSQQRRLVNAWIEFLPTVPAKTIVFSSKVSKELFDAVCLAPNVKALSLKWSSVESLNSISNVSQLEALYLGSSPKIETLAPLGYLQNLRWIFIENPMDVVDISFLRNLKGLIEFGISASRGKKLTVKNLEPIAGLAHLKMLWLISIKVEEGGLSPLKYLQNLESFRSTIRKSSKEFSELCEALPNLKYFQSVG